MRIKLGHPLDARELYTAFPHESAVFTGGTIHAVTTDSREVESGDLFVALNGKHVHGADYIVSARARGAAASIMKNGLSVLYRLAESYRRKQVFLSVAVTGSVGKTSTKELLRALLSMKYRVFASHGNHNNELGVPLTLLSTPSDTEVLITELGMRGRGEIESLSRLVEPDYAVITAIGQSHLSELGTLLNIKKAKFEITSGLREGGSLFLGTGVTPPDEKALPVSVFSLSTSYDTLPAVYGIRMTEGGTYFHLRTDNQEMRELLVPAYGAHMARNAALAALVALEMGLSEDEVRQGLLLFQNVGQRSEIRVLRGITLILDCYNASPESMTAAAELLKGMKGLHPGSRAFALIGDMLELGDDADALHLAVGQIFGRLPLSGLYVYGEKSDCLLAGARLVGFRGILSDKPCLLREVLVPGDILLIKASRGMEAEKLASTILGGVSL